MDRYFLHLRDGTDEIIDPEGVEYPSLEAMRRAVMASARDLIAGDVRRGLVDLRFRIDVEDGAGETIYTLPFEHAVSVIPNP